MTKPKAVLNRFLVERIHKDWIDRLYPQGWEEEGDPHPTAFDNTILTLTYFSIAEKKLEMT